MIGVFDSGVGGLSILREIRNALPHYSYCYLADQTHVPYGARSYQEIREFSVAISNWLISQGAKLIVVACNTASGAALQHLRQVFPDTPFVGLVPPVKPAAEQTKSGKIAVLATSVTLQGKLYLNVKTKFAGQVIIYQDTCSGLVSQIEKGEIEHPTTRYILQKALELPLQQGIDKVVLGCTHYPFVTSVIQEIVGDSVELIDPAPAIARHAAHLLKTYQILPDNIKVERFVSTDNSEKLQNAIKNLLHEDHHTVESIYWTEKLTLNSYSIN